MEQEPQTPAFKVCNTCKKKDAIPAEDHRVTCARCRERSRRQYLRKKSSAEEREKVALGLMAKEMEKDIRVFRSLKKPKKRKIVRTEYQTADGLYEALRNVIMSSYMPEFHGRFSIIMDPTITHLGRARLVANSLRAFANYPMSPSAHTITNDESGASVRFHCTCLASDSNTKLQPTRPKASLQSNGVACSSDQSQGEGTKLAEALQASFTRDCKGAIRIKVLPDSSHPLGIAGQRISIDIIH